MQRLSILRCTYIACLDNLCANLKWEVIFKPLPLSPHRLVTEYEAGWYLELVITFSRKNLLPLSDIEQRNFGYPTIDYSLYDCGTPTWIKLNIFYRQKFLISRIKSAYAMNKPKYEKQTKKWRENLFKC
jgi:hypothetical protein